MRHLLLRQKEHVLAVPCEIPIHQVRFYFKVNPQNKFNCNEPNKRAITLDY